MSDELDDVAEPVLPADEVAELRRLVDVAANAAQPWQVIDAEQAIQHRLRLALPALLDAYEHQGELRAEIERLSNELEGRDAQADAWATVARLRTAADALLTIIDEGPVTPRPGEDHEALSGRLAENIARSKTAVGALRAALDATTAEEATDG